jgi:Mn2+/Fe2+ NRAMP family transporter
MSVEPGLLELFYFPVNIQSFDEFITGRSCLKLFGLVPLVSIFFPVGSDTKKLSQPDSKVLIASAVAGGIVVPVVILILIIIVVKKYSSRYVVLPLTVHFNQIFISLCLSETKSIKAFILLKFCRKNQTLGISPYEGKLIYVCIL